MKARALDESTLRYLGIEVDDALEMAEHTDVSMLMPGGRLTTRCVGDSYRSIRVAGTPDHDKKQRRSKQQSERADDCRQFWAAAQCEVEAEQRDGCG